MRTKAEIESLIVTWEGWLTATRANQQQWDSQAAGVSVVRPEFEEHIQFLESGLQRLWNYRRMVEGANVLRVASLAR
jgi:hypothetical protein